MKKMVGGFFLGLNAPRQGLKLIRTLPGLWKYAIVPFLLTAIVLIAGFVVLPSELVALVGGLVPAAAGFWGTVLNWAAMAFMWISAILLTVVFVVLFANLVAIPFHSILAEKTLIQLGVIPDRPFEVGRWLKVTVRMFMVGLVKAVFFLSIGALLFVLSFIPPLQLIIGFLTLMIAAFDCIDYSLELKEMGFGERLKYFKNHLPELAGFGSALGLIMMIPGLNFFLFPAAVVGGGYVLAQTSSSVLKEGSTK